ncbi:MAG: hypothetical protein OWT28_00095 [Firmicutes bacterium]|nr:hypothetical protein [Bacillota bacterium]
MANGVTDVRRFQIDRLLIQRILGIIWLLDGLLQLQPGMFSAQFMNMIITPNTQGQPEWYVHDIQWMANLTTPHIAIYNALFAVIQLVIGLGLILNVKTRATLTISFVWAVIVWFAGEGLGGLLTGSALYLTGAPGAVILYAMIGLLVWPLRSTTAQKDRIKTAVDNGLLGGKASLGIFSLIWLLGALLQLSPFNLQPDTIAQAIASGASGNPEWLAGLAHTAARIVTGGGTYVSLGLCLLQVGIAGGIWGKRRMRRAALILGWGLCLVYWVIGQQLGGIFTGMGTDPNAAPLLALFELAIWPLSTVADKDPGRAPEKPEHFQESA